MYIITVYGWENRAATRIQIGCEAMALNARAFVGALGYKTKLDVGPEPDRSDAEQERAKRLMDKVGPTLFNLN